MQAIQPAVLRSVCKACITTGEQHSCLTGRGCTFYLATPRNPDISGLAPMHGVRRDVSMINTHDIERWYGFFNAEYHIYMSVLRFR